MRLARMIQAVDAHACGEPGRVIVGGVLNVPGRTLLDKMIHLRDHADGLRQLMLREPRGYPASNCNLILPPTHPEAAAAYVIMEHTEYPGMSGSNTKTFGPRMVELALGAGPPRATTGMTAHSAATAARTDTVARVFQTMEGSSGEIAVQDVWHRSP